MFCLSFFLVKCRMIVCLSIAFSFADDDDDDYDKNANFFLREIFFDFLLSFSLLRKFFVFSAKEKAERRELYGLYRCMYKFRAIDRSITFGSRVQLNILRWQSLLLLFVFGNNILKKIFLKYTRMFL